AYLINLSSPDELIFDKSLRLFKAELSLAEDIGAEYLVTHLGTPKGNGRGFAMAQIKKALQEVKKSGINKETTILFENSAHKGMTGADITEIGEAIKIARKAGLKAGMCFDTCHGFAAGYAMQTRAEAEGLAVAIQEAVGEEGLKLIHLNDSKGEAGRGVDRHANIGEGRMCENGLKAFLRADGIKGLPVILETPKVEEGDDIKNLSAARRLIGQRARAGT
ncbi:MAG: deoxyribonuclease IV, partial [Thermodesulfobacteriota bacterium]